MGYIGKVHLRNILNLKSAGLIAVSDTSEKALANARKTGIRKTFTDSHKLLADPDIDAVIIALPTYLHKDLATEAAEAGKHILLEKPLARNVEEGKEILSVTRKNGVKLMIGYDLRFSPPLLELKEKIQNGTLGEIEIAYATNIGAGPFSHRAEGSIPRPVPSWWFNKELTGGGVLIDLGSHLINLTRWYFGEITDIKSYLGYRFNLDLEDRATCVVKFASGTVAVVNVGWFSFESQLKVDLMGTVKHASASHIRQNQIVAGVQLLTTNSCRYYIPYFRELEYFVHCIRHDLQPQVSGDDALNDLVAITRAYNNALPLT